MEKSTYQTADEINGLYGRKNRPKAITQLTKELEQATGWGRM